MGIEGDKICEYCIGYPEFKLADLISRSRNPKKEQAKTQLLQIEINKNLMVERAKGNNEIPCVFSDPAFDGEHFKKFIYPDYLPHPCEGIKLNNPSVSNELPGVFCCPRCWEENRDEYWFQELFRNLGEQVKLAKLVFFCVFWRCDIMPSKLWKLSMELGRPEGCESQTKGPGYMCDECRNALRDGAGPGRWNKKYPWLPEYFKESGELRDMKR
jgi:hypothetical protein